MGLGRIAVIQLARHPPTDILLLGDGFEVVGVDASTVPAEVVDL